MKNYISNINNMRLIKWLSPVFLLSVFLLSGCDKVKYNFDDLPDTVKGYFTIPGNVFEIDESIPFTNNSESAESYTWDFGDGTKSTEKDPVKAYSSSGIYTVILKAVGAGGTGTYSQTVTIKENAPEVTYKELYFIELNNDLIKKVSLEPGSTAENVADITGKGGVGLAYDSVAGKIYFSDFDSDNGKIWRMDMDGSNMEELVSGITDPYSIALNLNAGKIYWADDDGNIGRSNLDGSDVERSFINIDGGWMRGIAYDSKHDIIYFYEVYDENLYAANSNGGSVTKIIQGAYGYCIFVDEVNEKLYYEDRNVSAIMQANLDGSGIVQIAEAPDNTRIHGMGIDYSTNKFYWADRDKGIIKRSNLDGSGVEPFLTNIKSPRGLFIK